jgi:hypothetical protein
LSHTPYKIDTFVSLGVILTLLVGSVVVSLIATRKPKDLAVSDS